MNTSDSVTFDSLFTVLNSKQEVIVTFLAILELMRMQLIRCQQGKQFDTIRLYAALDLDAQEKILEEYYDTVEKDTLPNKDNSL